MQDASRQHLTDPQCIQHVEQIALLRPSLFTLEFLSFLWTYPALPMIVRDLTPRLHLITGLGSSRLEFSSPRERKINCMKLKAHYEIYPAQSHAYHHL